MGYDELHYPFSFIINKLKVKYMIEKLPSFDQINYNFQKVLNTLTDDSVKNENEDIEEEKLKAELSRLKRNLDEYVG